MRKDCTVSSEHPLWKELQNYKKRGVELQLDGRPSTPMSICHACRIAEEGYYMRDYTFNQNGDIKKISFDFVEKKMQ